MLRRLIAAVVLATAAAFTMVTPAFMTTLSIPSKTYHAGTSTVGPLTVNPGDNFLYVQTQATNWSASDSVTMDLYESFDGGVTYPFHTCSIVSPGPIASTDQEWQCGLVPPPSGQTYLAKATITLSGGNLTTPVLVETSPTPII